MIRKARAEDFMQIQAIVREVHDLHFQARPDVYEDSTAPLEKEHYIELLRDPNVEVFVKDIESEIAAYSILKSVATPKIPILKPSQCIFIDAFAVKSSYRRKGFGKELFEYIQQYARDTGGDSIQLGVWEFNDAAIRFYESVGMTTRNRRMEIPIL